MPVTPSSAPVRETYGTLPDDGGGDTEVSRWVLDDGRGLTAAVLSRGGIVQSLRVPDREGNRAEVTLGFDSLDGYLKPYPYFGATIGRFGNRIAGGGFELDGRAYRVPLSDAPLPNALHGGTRGFDKHDWSGRALELGEAATGMTGVELSRVSPDGEEGFPGRLEVSVRFLVGSGTLRIEYRATTDAPTVVNLTNHGYLNLAGTTTADALDHLLTVRATHYLPVDERMIPLGEPAPVAGTPFDFTAPRRLGERLGGERTGGADPQLARAEGYDHCLVLDGGVTAEPRPVATLLHEGSGRRMTLATTEPGVQLYTAQHLDGTVAGHDGVRYGPHAGVALETEHYPDSPNRPDYPSTVLRPGETYRSCTEYRFDTYSG